MFGKKFFIASTLVAISSSALANNYCTGIRGNGEMAPAHWASLSRIVENKGLPSTVAGGSSAAITMFLTDALSRNDNLHPDEVIKNHELGLLYKTILPHLLYLFKTDAQSPVIMKAIGLYTGMGDGGFFHKLKSGLKIAGSFPEFMEILGDYGPLLNPEVMIGLRKDFSFHKAQLAEAVAVFGSFDAKNDKNLFYRNGIVDFKFLGILFGRVADFYAGYGNTKTNESLRTFLNACSDNSVNKDWKELVTTQPECMGLFNDALDSYYKKPTKMVPRRTGRGYRKVTLDRVFPNKMIFEKVGSGINAYPTTAVVHGSGALRYKKQLDQFMSNKGIGVPDFNLDFDTELDYGYWGDNQKLDDIHSNLQSMFPNDLKSSKFRALKDGLWFEVLATSPAEPGLSNLQRIPRGIDISRSKVLDKKYFKRKWLIFPSAQAISWHDEKKNKGVVPFRDDIYSAGGWSDLHPTLVLRASGCDEVLYLTRQGGESVFGQQVFIRLTGYSNKIRFWDRIRTRNRIGWTDLNDEERNSPWNRLYNLGNPNSSYNRSLEEMNSVYCTNWDGFNAFKPAELQGAIMDAYNAPVFLKDESNREEQYDFGYDFVGKSPDGFPGCLIK